MKKIKMLLFPIFGVLMAVTLLSTFSIERDLVKSGLRSNVDVVTYLELDKEKSDDIYRQIVGLLKYRGVEQDYSRLDNIDLDLVKNFVGVNDEIENKYLVDVFDFVNIDSEKMLMKSKELKQDIISALGWFKFVWSGKIENYKSAADKMILDFSNNIDFNYNEYGFFVSNGENINVLSYFNIEKDNLNFDAIDGLNDGSYLIKKYGKEYHLELDKNLVVIQSLDKGFYISLIDRNTHYEFFKIDNRFNDSYKVIDNFKYKYDELRGVIKNDVRNVRLLTSIGLLLMIVFLSVDGLVFMMIFLSVDIYRKGKGKEVAK